MENNYRNVKRKAVFILFLFSQTILIYSQSIKGYIYDENNNEIEFANVLLFSSIDSTYIDGVVTDSIGYFQIEKETDTNTYLRVSFIGYLNHLYTITNNTEESVVKIILEKDSITNLNEVVVEARVPTYSIKDGILTTNVANSILGREHDINEVLRKIPGVTYNNEDIEVFGLGKPTIYINGRKIQTKAEVERLLPSDIEKIQLITNPGSKYDASVKAVIIIKTINREEGLSLRIKSDDNLGRRLKQDHTIDINYQKNNTTMFGSYNYYDNRKRSIQGINTNMSSDTIWQYKQNLISNIRNISHEYQLGMNIDLQNNASIGIKYDGSINKNKSHADENDIINANEEYFTFIKNNSKNKDEIYNHHLNAFLTMPLNKKTQYYLYTDYLYNKNDKSQRISEKTDNMGVQNIYLKNKTDFSLYGINTYVNFDFENLGTFTLGYDFSYLKGHGNILEDKLIVPNQDYKNSETKNSVYFDLKGSLSKELSYNLGLRYEYVESEYKDLLKNENNLNKYYSNLFPSVGLNYKHNSFNHVLNYSRKIVRPQFSIMNSNVYYSNRFMFQSGNPLITSEKDDVLQYNLLYKSYYFAVSYTHKSDFIAPYFYTDHENNSRFISSYKNYNNSQQLLITLYNEQSFGIYRPSLSSSFLQPFFKVSVDGNQISYNNPMFILNFNNNLKFSNGILVNFEYQYNSGGNYLFFKFEPTHVFNTNIKKSFFKNNLDINLYARDIFNGGKNKYKGAIDNIIFSQNEDQDKRKIGISLIYKLNNYKNKYKGKNSLNNEINRL